MSGFNWNLGPKDPDDPEQKKPEPPQLEEPPATEAYPVFPTGSYGYPPTEPVAPPAPAPAWPPAANLPGPVWPPAAPPPTTQPPVSQPPQTQPPVQPPVVQPPAPAWPPAEQASPPTQAWPPAAAYEDAPTQAYPFDQSLSGATEILGTTPIGGRPASAIDSLFGESQFKEYEAGPFPSEGLSALASTRPRAAREPMGRPQKVLLIVAGALVGVLALVGLFMLGTKLDGIFPPAQPEAAIKPTAEAPVAAVAPVVGPVAAGTYGWADLLGTECLDPFTNAWQESYTVVDCAAPHAAQMIYTGIFTDEAYAAYPGIPELQARINLLCTSPTTVNYPAASQFADIQIGASFAATAEDWDAGDRSYYCFVTRSSGEALTASVANPPVPVDAPIASIAGNDP